MWKLGRIAAVVTVSLAACTGDVTETDKALAVPDGTADERPGGIRMQPITVEEGAALLPSLADARQVTAPRLLPQHRVLAEYCARGSASALADSLAARLRSAWTDVVVDAGSAGDRRGIRATRDGYALGVTLAPGGGGACPAEQVMLRMAVFRPLEPRALARGSMR